MKNFQNTYKLSLQIPITAIVTKLIYDNGISENINADTNVKDKVSIVPFIVH